MPVTGSSLRTVGAVLEAGCAAAPDVVVLGAEGELLTYADLAGRAGRMRAVLHRLGLQQGDRVLLMLHNSTRYVDCWLGLATNGIVEVPVNTQYRGELLRHLVINSEATAIVVDGELAPLVAALGTDVGLLGVMVVAGETLPDWHGAQHRLDDLLQETEDAPVPAVADVAEHDVHAVMYTSGTTGPSKGVVVTHAHSYEYTLACVRLLDLAPGDRYYAPLPLFHVTGQWALVYACLLAQATAILKPRFKTDEFWPDVEATGATVSFLVGAMANFVLAAGGDGVSTPLERVLMVPLIDELDTFRERFGVRVSTCYGSTEMNVPIRAYFDEVDDPTSCGRIVPGFDIRIVDDADHEVPDGTVGELCIRAHEPWTQMVEYLNNPEATASAFRNLWLHTGDAVVRDVDGSYRFVDRIKDAIRRRGENISSWEVEREANAHSDVLESAAVAAPAEHGEDEVRIFVVARPGADLHPAQFLAFMAERAPRFMLPTYVEVVESLPKTPTGKVQKQKLRDLPLSSPLDRPDR